MSSNLIKRLISVFLGLICLVAYSASIETANQPLRVLWVFSWNKDLPWQREIEDGFNYFYKTINTQTLIYYEYMDAGRFDSIEQTTNFKHYLLDKYANSQLDHIIFESEPATRFYIDNQADFKQAEITILNPEFELNNIPSNSAIIPVSLDYSNALKSLLTLEPNKKIYLISGAEKNSIKRSELVSQLIKQYQPSTKIINLKGLPLEQLIQQVALLDKNSILLYLLMFEDNQGKRYVPYNVVEQLSQHASVPTYSFWTSLLGSGIVGGYMLSGEKVGTEAAKALGNSIRTDIQIDSQTGNQIIADKTIQASFHGNYYDWRQLERWNINSQRLPKNSEIKFQQPSIMMLYYRELIVGIFISIGLILWFRNRELKRYSNQIQAGHQQLQQTHQQLLDAQKCLEIQNEQLNELAIRDPLTRLFNRAHLDKTLEQEVLRTQRYNNELSIIMLDIDHFKRINDQFGHQCGDQVLIKISEILKSNLRITDTLARWGGEEFMILCPNSSLQQTYLLAEKLRSSINKAHFDKAAEVTASFGVASFNGEHSIQQLISEADDALYQSKNTGRNKVTSAH